MQLSLCDYAIIYIDTSNAIKLAAMSMAMYTTHIAWLLILSQQLTTVAYMASECMERVPT